MGLMFRMEKSREGGGKEGDREGRGDKGGRGGENSTIMKAPIQNPEICQVAPIHK